MSFGISHDFSMFCDCGFLKEILFDAGQLWGLPRPPRLPTPCGAVTAGGIPAGRGKDGEFYASHLRQPRSAHATRPSINKILVDFS